MKPITMLDLKSEFPLFEHEIRQAVHAVLESQQFINGPAVGELERAMCATLGVKHAAAVSNGSDALVCALMALEIGPGDEVIVPTFSFFATAGSVYRVGARPIFVDCDPRDFTMDVEKFEAALTPRSRAVIPVHLFGQCADMTAIRAVARKHGLKIIEDAAQALGATHRDRPVGALGDIACVSFYPTKNLGGFGEGGMILTEDEELATICEQLRNHGQSDLYIHERVGANFRLDTLKAAILLVKLKYWPMMTRKRREHAAWYDELLQGAPVKTPCVAQGNTCVYHQYSILCDRRDALKTSLADKGIGTGIYYPLPLHRQPCFAPLGPPPDACPVADDICRRILSLPVHPMLSREDVERVAGAIREFYEKGG